MALVFRLPAAEVILVAADIEEVTVGEEADTTVAVDMGALEESSAAPSLVSNLHDLPGHHRLM